MIQGDVTSNSASCTCEHQCCKSKRNEVSGRVSPSLIQIKAESEDEVKRRIEAFMKSKRNEVDERNIREFISPFSLDSENSCARVEAVYVHREGGKSHIALKKVENLQGPQTQCHADSEGTKRSHQLPVSVQRAEAVEERLANMETHLCLTSDHMDVFSRIKALESRISFLEGISPEYFNNVKPSQLAKKQGHIKEETQDKSHNASEPESLSDINKRIRFLKEVLRQKAK
ncbi:MAP3K12-binding inhibitory protein 1 isoform X2 [Aplysia californica]|uniref:MAP3K12-binding inhibitory protein 1 isoform X2 n=1 Tax=Aplysia californica TaxID=6500 RepID=A0ABM0JCX1_APLCA|nr:MAP3K12-binding inhibitory protein 1 isoform X2 [Aplysia californica]